MAEKLRDYLCRHPEIDECLGRGGQRSFRVSSLNNHAAAVAAALFEGIPLTKA